MRPISGDPDADRYLEALASRTAGILGDRLVGVYAINSAARGDYVPGRSDLDVSVVVADALAPATKHRLADALRHSSLPCPAPRLELVVYRRTVVVAPGPMPEFELNLNSGQTIEDHLATDPADEPAHWFVLDLAAAAEMAKVLIGQEASEVFGAVPRRVALDALRASRDWHARHDTAAPNRVLNDCRAWLFAAEGRWSTKSEAAGWAIAAGGDADLVRHALALRDGTGRDPLDAVAVDRFSTRVGDVLASVA